MLRSMTNPDEADLRQRVRDLLEAHPPATTERLTFLQAQYDAGLAWVGFPVGLGGLGLPRHLQRVVNEELVAAGAPHHKPPQNRHRRRPAAAAGPAPRHG